MELLRRAYNYLYPPRPHYELDPNTGKAIQPQPVETKRVDGNLLARTQDGWKVIEIELEDGSVFELMPRGWVKSKGDYALKVPGDDGRAEIWRRIQ